MPHMGITWSSVLFLDMLHFSGELFGQFTASLSNWAGLLKPSAEWRRTGL
jgi:hypothetical protein